MPKAGPAAKAADDGAKEAGGATPPAAPPKPAKEATTARRGPSTIDLTGLGSLTDQEDHLNAIWWGKEGSGKTTDVLTAANRGRVLVVNAEGGIKKRALREFGIDLENIVPWPAKGHEEDLTVPNLMLLAEQLRAELQEDPNAWYAVVWDSVTEIYDIAVAGVRAVEFDKNASLPVAKQKEHRNDPFFTDLSDYGTATEQLRVLIRRYRDLPCHFLVTALERRDVDEDSGKVAYGPAVGPAVQKALLGYLDININAVNDALRTGPDAKIDLVDEYIGTTRSDGMVRAKDRLKALPRTLPVPTFERVLDYVDDKTTQDTDTVYQEWLAQRADHSGWLQADKEAKAAVRAAARGGRQTQQSA